VIPKHCIHPRATSQRSLRLQIPAFTALSLIVAGINLHAQAYTYTDLGTFGGIYGGAYGINSSGQLTGYAYDEGSQNHAFLYSNGILTDLGFLSGGSSTRGTGVSSSGQVAGYGTTAAGQTHAFLYSSGNMTDIGTLPGGGMSQAIGISSSGQVVGFSTTAAFSKHTFLYSSGNMTDIGTLPGGALSEPTGINSSGQIVGYSMTSAAYTHAFIYSNGTMTDIGTLPGGSDSRATGISSSGLVVGYSIDPILGDRTFIYSNGTMTDIGTLGGTASRGIGINSSGQVIGTSHTTGNTYIHPYLYSNGTMYDFTTLVPYQVSDITLNAINDWGQIAGVASDTISRIRPVLFNPVDPLTNTTTGVTNTKFVAGMTYDKFTAATNTGGLGTSVNLLGGTAGSAGNGTYGLNRDVNVSFVNAQPGLASDIVEFSGTAGIGFSDMVVLQLTYDEATANALFGTESCARLGWIDPGTGKWMLAVYGNTGGTAFFAGNRAYNALTDFVLGTYGVDTANNTVWAVINHNSTFAVVPEPSTCLLLAVGVGIAMFGFRFRHRKTRRF